MELILRPLSIEQGQFVFETYMAKDFPQSELKPWPLMEALARQGEYDMLGVFLGEEMLGYAWQFCPRGGKAVLVDYFAILPQYRGTGWGEKVVELLRNYYHIPILLESEEPTEAPDEAIARRRLGFYSRCGMMDTGLQLRLFGVRFCILASCKVEKARSVMEEIYDGLLGPELAQSAVEYL